MDPEASSPGSVRLDFESEDLLEFTYVSPNESHQAKRAEVALYVLGTLSDDIIKF